MEERCIQSINQISPALENSNEIYRKMKVTSSCFFLSWWSRKSGSSNGKRHVIDWDLLKKQWQVLKEYKERLSARQPDIYLFTTCLDLCAHTQWEMCLSFLAATFSFRRAWGKRRKKKYKSSKRNQRNLT